MSENQNSSFLRILCALNSQNSEQNSQNAKETSPVATCPRRPLSDIQCNIVNNNNKRRPSLITDYLKSSKKYKANLKCPEEHKNKLTNESSHSDSELNTSNSSSDSTEHEVLAEWEIKLRDGMDAIAKDKSLLYNKNEATLAGPLALVEKETILRRIEEKLAEIRETQEIRIRNRTWENCVFFEDRLVLKPPGQAKMVVTKFSNSASNKKFILLVLLLNKIRNLLLSNSKCTKRETYYQNVATIPNQNLVNEAFDNISCLLDVGPWEFGIVASNKGLVYGNLKIFFSCDEFTNCNVPGGAEVPQDMSKIVKVASTAYFILVVEKDSIFQKLLDEDLPNRLTRPFIMITGKGYPDINTRLFLRKLWTTMSIPVFVLVDADPDGIDILLTYKFGSLRQSHISDKLVIPNLRWLGVLPSEITLLNVTRQAMNEREKKKVKDMLTRPYIEAVPKLKRELEVLASKEVKAEIEGLMKNDEFLSQVYLPNKFYTRDYL